MAWQTPKTDWKVELDANGKYLGDFFNWSDYERIRGNLEWFADNYRVPLVEMQSIDETVITYPEFTGYTTGAAITDQMRYAAPVVVDTHINPIERNLDIIADSLFRPTDYPATKTWHANLATPTWQDLNRWERCIQIVHDTTKSISAYRLAYTLGMTRGDIR